MKETNELYESDLKATLFTETLHAAHSYSRALAFDGDEWGRMYCIQQARYHALLSIIESLPGLEEEYQAFKFKVYEAIGVTGKGLKDIDVSALYSAIKEVIRDAEV